MYLEHKNLKKKKKKKYEEQQKELLKYRNHYKGRTTNNAPAPQYKKIKLSDIKFCVKNLRNLLTAQKKPKKRCYYDLYSDNSIESGDEFSENDSESNNEEIVKKEKKTQTRKRTVAKTTTKPAKKKRRKRTQRNYRLYK